MKTYCSWDKFHSCSLENITYVNLLTLQENKEDRIEIIGCGLCHKPKPGVLWMLTKYWYKITRVIYVSGMKSNVQLLSTKMWPACFASHGSVGCQQCLKTAPLKAESAKHVNTESERQFSSGDAPVPIKKACNHQGGKKEKIIRSQFYIKQHLKSSKFVKKILSMTVSEEIKDICKVPLVRFWNNIKWLVKKTQYF